MVAVKREMYKGEYNVVVRDKKGRILSRRKWNKNFTIQKAVSKFKRDNTLTEDVRKVKLTNVVEITDERVRARRPTGGRIQYVIEGKLPDGKVIVARSQTHDPDYPKSEMREEALESFRERIAQAFGKEYDEDVGAQLVEEHKISYREGFVYYQRASAA